MQNPFLLHAGLMIIAWLVLLPSGAMIARFCKVTRHQDWPRVLDNQLWWWLHRVLQYCGIATASAGLAIVWYATGRLDIQVLHVQVGVAVLALAFLQIASTWLRGSKGGPTGSGAERDQPLTWRGDHYDMTPRRRMFEFWHKKFGWLSILLALLAVFLGLQLYGWPRSLCIACMAIILLQAGNLTWLMRTSRRISTYQALWGPDPRHPGNRKDPGQNQAGP